MVTLAQPRTDEKALPFLDTARKNGDLVHYGDTFIMKNQNNHHVSPAYPTIKAGGGGSLMSAALVNICVDLGVAAYFPRVGQPGQAPLAFVTPVPDPAPQINDQSLVFLASREPGPGARNLLGAWADSHDCYYYDEYLDGENRNKQTWRIVKVTNAGQPLRYGDKIRLVNLFYGDKGGLEQDTRWGQSEWLTTGKGGDTWTIEPAPAQV